MKAGELNRRLTIQRAVYTINALNEKVPSWQELMVVWASKRDVSDCERIASQQVSAYITTRFKLRWSRLAATISPTDRLVFDGRIYEIYSCKETDFHDGIEISAAARNEVELSTTTTPAIGSLSTNGGQGAAQAQGSMIVAGAGSATGQG